MLNACSPSPADSDDEPTSSNPPKSRKKKGDQDDDDAAPAKLSRSTSKSKSFDYGEVFTSASPYGALEHGVKIVSWNVNGLRSLLKPPFLFADYLRREHADIVCVQVFLHQSSQIFRF